MSLSDIRPDTERRLVPPDSVRSGGDGGHAEVVETGEPQPFRSVPSSPPTPQSAGGRPVIPGQNRVPSWLRIALSSPGLVLAWAVIIVVTFWALFPGLFTTHDPYQTVTAGGLLPPSTENWFGTDSVGRDQYTRVVYGAGESLRGAAIAVTLGLGVGTLLGLVAGTGRRLVEEGLMRIVDVLLAIPGLLLALTIVVILGPGTVNVAIAVGVGSIASFARLVRAQVVQVRNTDYVEAARATGARGPGLLFRHVLPNSLTPVLALVALNFGGAILALSTLGFLGYGVQPPDPEWGMIIAQGRDLLAVAWWVTTIPGLIVVAVVLSANRISRSFSQGRR